MKDFARAAVIALFIGVAVAVGAYLTAPGPQQIYPPLPVGVVPAELVAPVGPTFTPICGLDCQVK